jgi:4-hydroxythreonine-4-phosphate dehydrogenase
MRAQSNRPIIAITMGDPSGVGPEIILKALTDKELYDICIPVVIGDENIISSVREKVFLNKAPSVNPIKELDQALGLPGIVDLISVSHLKEYRPAAPYTEAGRAMVSYIKKAVQMALNKEVSAVVTCPINKYLMHEAGFQYDGHTPFIAHLTHSKDYVMMLSGQNLKVTLVTIHVALKDVPNLITEQRVYKTICVTTEALIKDFGIQSPRIAVSALNPHAGEKGLYGKEEEIILSAIKKAKARYEKQNYNLKIDGPFPPDTVYYMAFKGKYDVVVSMYHDQGLIPLKLLHFSDAVNVTLGLPIVRTSVDHGTAYDIAGKGIADETSLKSAIKTAVLISKNRSK